MLLTIVTVVRNGEDHIVDCLNHIRQLKCLTNIEHVIIDGNSSDSTVEICNNYDCVVYQQEGIGIYNAMNQGVSCANGDYILFSNADDYIDVEGLYKALTILSNEMDKNHLFAVNIIGDSGTTKLWKPSSTISRIYSMPAPHPGMIVKRSLLENELRFSEKFNSSSDFDMALRLVKLDSHSCHDIVVANFRAGGESSRFNGVVENHLIRKDQKLSVFIRVKGFLYDTFQFIRGRFGV